MTSPTRSVPILHDLNRGFWTAGSAGELHVRRCAACHYWVHPPSPMCPRCRGRELPWEATSGTGVLYSYTHNVKAWNPDVPTPYVIGIVELPEQAGLRLTTNIVNCEPDELVIGMLLTVVFEQQGEYFIPLFAPDPANG